MHSKVDSISEWRNNNKKRVIFVVLPIMAVLFFYFYFAHPIYIYDSDDWTYISYPRQLFPSIKQWNPTKVLPETLMPLVSEFAVRFIYPFTGDYVGALAVGFAIVMSLLIALFTAALLGVLENLFSVNWPTLFLLGILLVLSYWLPYNTTDTNNRFLFYGGNANCHFNYVVPGIFNGVAVLLFLRSDFDRIRMDKEKWITVGAIVLFLYLCVHSNMFHSIILISFLCARLFFMASSMLIGKRRIGGVYDLIKHNVYDLIIILCWLISISMESQGDRAKWASGTTLSHLPVGETLRQFGNSVFSLHPIWWVGTGSIVLFALLLFLTRRKRQDECDGTYVRTIRELFVALVITVAYLILLCAKVTPSYIANNTVMISWMILLVIICFVSLGYIISRIGGVVAILPFTTAALIFNTVIDGHTFAENNVVWNYDINTVKELDYYYIGQIVEADQAGADHVEIPAPVSDSYAWPLDYSYAGDRIAVTLFRHGIIKSQIHAVMVPDPSVNERFNLPTATMP